MSYHTFFNVIDLHMNDVIILGINLLFLIFLISAFIYDRFKEFKKKNFNFSTGSSLTIGTFFIISRINKKKFLHYEYK
jgi:hypothetical protein